MYPDLPDKVPVFDAFSSVRTSPSSVENWAAVGSIYRWQLLRERARLSSAAGAVIDLRKMHVGDPSMSFLEIARMRGMCAEERGANAEAQSNRFKRIHGCCGDTWIFQVFLGLLG